MNSWITLTDLRFHAHHGVLEHERLCGNTFVVQLRMAVDITCAAQTDDINEALNYAEVFACWSMLLCASCVVFSRSFPKSGAYN